MTTKAEETRKEIRRAGCRNVGSGYITPSEENLLRIIDGMNDRIEELEQTQSRVKGALEQGLIATGLTLAGLDAKTLEKFEIKERRC